mmetsp:Transcript_7003/g.42959  ORF Transcript_7003/g.42959 Transcript_7003/m.42959 type:complete len:352 (+) Transcript_7003:5309-6364(+)
MPKITSWMSSRSTRRGATAQPARDLSLSSVLQKSTSLSLTSRRVTEQMMAHKMGFRKGSSTIQSRYSTAPATTSSALNPAMYAARDTGSLSTFPCRVPSPSVLSFGSKSSVPVLFLPSFAGVCGGPISSNMSPCRVRPTTFPLDHQLHVRGWPVLRRGTAVEKRPPFESTFRMVGQGMGGLLGDRKGGRNHPNGRLGWCRCSLVRDGVQPPMVQPIEDGRQHFQMHGFSSQEMERFGMVQNTQLLDLGCSTLVQHVRAFWIHNLVVLGMEDEKWEIHLIQHLHCPATLLDRQNGHLNRCSPLLIHGIPFKLLLQIGIPFVLQFAHGNPSCRGDPAQGSCNGKHQPIQRIGS